MSNWAAKRRLLYTSYVVLFFAAIFLAVYFLYLYKPPTCFDNIKNGFEEGVDCGGGCAIVCPFSASVPNVQWVRSFEVGPGLYNLAAVVENPNFSIGANVEYVFRGYNTEGVLVAEVFGETPLYPAEIKPLFEPSVETGKRTIDRVFLEFIGEPTWRRLNIEQNKLVSSGYILENEDSFPQLRARIVNTYFKPLSGIEVMAVVYDENENIYQTSKTFIERIPADGTAEAFFTWRKPFEIEVNNIEIYIVEPRGQE